MYVFHLHVALQESCHLHPPTCGWNYPCKGHSSGFAPVFRGFIRLFIRLAARSMVGIDCTLIRMVLQIALYLSDGIGDPLNPCIKEYCPNDDSLSIVHRPLILPSVSRRSVAPVSIGGVMNCYGRIAFRTVFRTPDCTNGRDWPCSAWHVGNPCTSR